MNDTSTQVLVQSYNHRFVIEGMWHVLVGLPNQNPYAKGCPAWQGYERGFNEGTSL